jgi:prepilin-type N-terminal cleavage/methylation domain-containing protein
VRPIGRERAGRYLVEAGMKKAFTLIEVLATLTIICILGGLIFAVGGSVFKSSHVQSTRVTVQLSRNLVAEHGMKGADGENLEWLLGGVLAQHAPNDRYAFYVKYHQDSTAPYQSWPMVVDAGEIPTDPAQWTSDTVLNSVLAWEYIGRIIPRRLPDEAKPVTVTIAGVPHTTRVLFDAWGRPLIFCPGAGMVTAANPAKGDRVQFFDGEDAGYLVPLDPAQDADPKLPSKWPFRRSWGFFSAGPDGDPSTFADNIWQ